MSDTPPLGLPEAARRLGVSVRVLRGAIRAGRIAAPPNMSAVVSLSPEWLSSAEAAVAASPQLLIRSARQKVPAST